MAYQSQLPYSNNYYPSQSGLHDMEAHHAHYHGYGTAHVENPDKSPAPAHSKGVFVTGRRKRMNIVPMSLALFGPVLMFYAMFSAVSFKLQYEKAWLCILIVLSGLLFCVFMMLVSVDSMWKKRKSSPLREPNWVIFMCCSFLLHWAAGVMSGGFNYIEYMRPFYDISGLGTYNNVDPSRMSGGQLMDAGRVFFTEGAHLDTSKAMLFKSITNYCAAPVVANVPPESSADGTQQTYDFWAIGKGCCTQSPKGEVSFTCGHVGGTKAHAGLRLMDDTDRPFYRLAVQQAEAAYGIKAAHPLFYDWMIDPVSQVNQWEGDGYRYYHMACVVSFVSQLFLVLTASVAFARLGQL